MIYLGPKASQEYWSAHDAACLQMSKLPEPRFSPGPHPSIAEIEKMGLPDGIVSRPLEIIVADDCSRRGSKGIKEIKFSNPPRGSFVQVDENFSVCTPEACFLLEARSLSTIWLICFGFMLCGTYHPDPNLNMVFDRTPFTNTARIMRYLERAAGAYGSAQASDALRFVCDNSASPMETRAAMILSLPSRLGGYGIEKPIMNKRVAIPAKSKDLFSRSYYLCDLFWDFSDGSDRQLVALEYDSNQYHAKEDKITLDTTRRNALTDLGLTVFGLTAKQAYDQREWDRLARQILRCAGKRLRTPSENVRKARGRLLNELGMGRLLTL